MNRIQQFIWGCISALICIAYKADVYGGCTVTLVSSRNTGYTNGNTAGCKTAVTALGSTAGTYEFQGINVTVLNNANVGNQAITQDLTVPKGYYVYNCTKNYQSIGLRPTAQEMIETACTAVITEKCPIPTDAYGASGVTPAAQTLRTYANSNTQTVYVCSHVWLGKPLTNVWAFKLSVKCTNEHPGDFGQISRCYLSNGYAGSDVTGYWEIDGGACYYSSVA